MTDLQVHRTRLTIGQIAKAANVPISTVRYYERVGLLKPDYRSKGNYRVYGEVSLRRLRFIRAAQGLGFTLDDVKALVGAHGEPLSCVEVQSLLVKRLSEIEAKLRDLRNVHRVLKHSLQDCLESEKLGRCQVIDKVTSA